MRLQLSLVLISTHELRAQTTSVGTEIEGLSGPLRERLENLQVSETAIMPTGGPWELPFLVVSWLGTRLGWPVDVLAMMAQQQAGMVAHQSPLPDAGTLVRMAIAMEGKGLMIVASLPDATAILDSFARRTALAAELEREGVVEIRLSVT